MAKVGDYKLLKLLGAGSFSKVFLAEHCKTEEKYAIKIVPKHKSKYAKEFNQLTVSEIKLLRKLDHKNIIRLYDYSAKENLVSPTGKEKEVFYMALELIPGGELFDFVFQTGRFEEKYARYYFLQLLDALEYLHGKGISHCDIKLSNVLLDEEFNLKLADFGFASTKPMNDTFKGSGEYIAPEIHLGKAYYGSQVDLFSAGVLLFILTFAWLPFRAAQPTDDYYK